MQIKSRPPIGEQLHSFHQAGFETRRYRFVRLLLRMYHRAEFVPVQPAHSAGEW